MVQTISLHHVLCRPALARDLEEIREFCKTIWGGQDYVPDVVDEWLHDPQGILGVADYQGRAIACSKITGLAEGQWWLEGFRVDPHYQGLKVGSLLHRYVDQWWLEHGRGVLRLMTSSKNKSVHHLSESTGFTKLFEVRGYKAEPLSGGTETFTAVTSGAEDLGKAVEYASASPSLALTDHVVDFGWRLLRLAPTEDGSLTSLLSLLSSFESDVFWWRNGRGLLILWDDFDSDEQEHRMGIGVVACQLEDMSSLLMDVRHLAAKQKKAPVFWLAPVHEQVERALQRAGYSSDWENTAYVFEKRHPSVP